MKVLQQRPFLVAGLVIISVVYAFYLRAGAFTQWEGSGLGLNTWDLTVGIATNQYFGYFVLIPAWILITAVEAVRGRDPLKVVRHGGYRIAAGSFTAQMLTAAALMVVLTGLAPAAVVSVGLPWEWGQSDYAKVHGYDSSGTATSFHPAVIQTAEFALRVLLLTNLSIVVWMIRSRIAHRGAFVLVCGLIAILPITLDRVTGGWFTRSASLSSASDIADVLIQLGSWAVAFAVLAGLVRWKIAMAIRSSLSPGLVAMGGIIALLVAAVLVQSEASPGGFHLSVAGALIGGTSYGFSTVNYMVYIFALLGPAVYNAMAFTSRTLPQLPYRAIRRGSLSWAVSEFLLRAARNTVVFWAVTATALGGAFLMLRALTAESTGTGTGPLSASVDWWWLWQFGPNTLLQIYAYTLVLVLLVLLSGGPRGILVGTLILIVLSVPALRANYVLPVAGSTGGALFDPVMPSPLYSLLLLTAWAVAGTTALLVLGRYRRELYLS